MQKISLVTVYSPPSMIIDSVNSWQGEQIWQAERVLEVHGQYGGIFFRGDMGKLVTGTAQQEVQTESAKGLFRLDTDLFLQHLLAGKPLYVDRAKILHAIATANACQYAATQNQIVHIAEETYKVH